MRLTLNNRSENLDGVESMSVSALLEYKRYTFPNIVVKVNGVLVRKEAYENTLLHEGDRVDMIHMVSGG